jgi:hypothetical protein
MRAFHDRYRDYYEAARPFKAEYEAELARIKATTAEAERAAYRKYAEDCRRAWEAFRAYPDDDKVTGKENDVG